MDACALLAGTQIGTATVEDNMEDPQKVKNRTTPQSSNCTTGYFPKAKTLIQGMHATHLYVYCSSIYNSQTMEPGQVSIDK